MSINKTWNNVYKYDMKRWKENCKQYYFDILMEYVEQFNRIFYSVTHDDPNNFTYYDRELDELQSKITNLYNAHKILLNDILSSMFIERLFREYNDFRYYIYEQCLRP